MTRKYRKMSERRESWSDGGGRYETVETREYGPRPLLRRNTIDGVFGGVCSGFGDYFGIDHTVLRILFVLSVIFLGFPLLAYFILWIFIPKDKRAPYYREYREAREARRKSSRKSSSWDDDDDYFNDDLSPITPTPGTASFRDVQSKYRSLEVRLNDLERSVTSKEWKLRREFRDLES